MTTPSDDEALNLRELAQQFLSGGLAGPEFLKAVGGQMFARLSDTSLDLDRQRRSGFPEVIFGEGKSARSLLEISRSLLGHGQAVLITRIDEQKSAALLVEFAHAIHNPTARTLRIARPAAASPGLDSDQTRATDAKEPNLPTAGKRLPGQALVVTAGTSDLPVAEEAMETLRWMDVPVELIQDIGVAGPQRLLAQLDRLRQADVIVVAAGMEGALPSVVGGHVGCPVIAVPTSVGYGANFGGLAALLGMLNSCAANVAVVNIDAGFKAGFLAGLIATGRTDRV